MTTVKQSTRTSAKRSIWNRKRQLAARLCLSASIFALTLGTNGSFSRQGISLYMPAAHASFGEEDVFGDMEPLKAEVLEAQRGGFKIAGLDINVGVSVTSSIDGFVQVTSSFSMSEAGKIVNLGAEVTTHPDVPMPDTSAIVDQQIAAAKAVMPDTSELVDQQIAATRATVDAATNAQADTPKPTISKTTDAGKATPLPVSDSTVSDAAQQVTQAVDVALNTFSQPEIFEDAEISDARVDTTPSSGPVSQTIANTTKPLSESPSDFPHTTASQTVPGGMTDAASTALDISNKISETAKTVASALADTPDAPPKATGNGQVSQPDGTKLTAADAIPSGQAASPSTSPQAAHAVVSTVSEPDTIKTTVTVPTQTASATSSSVPADKGMAQTQIKQKTPLATTPDTKIAKTGTGKTDTQQKAVPATVVPAVDTARITHTTANGHLSVIENTLNGVSIRQMVSMNLTIENFKEIQHISEMRRNITTIARQISIQSLRR